MQKGFTLIELLVTVAILSVLATVVVVIINPASFLKQGRDSTRLSDLSALNNSLGTLLVDFPQADFGDVNTVYVSVPDSDLNCANLGLPTLPSGYTYHCSPSSVFTSVDGAGWIPVDFTTISSGSPLSRLPVDPINTTSSFQYYEYLVGTSSTWKIISSIESTKQLSTATKDGGIFSFAYETGSNITMGNGIFPGGAELAPNGGVSGQTDWIDSNLDGLGNNWIKQYGSENVSIVTGNGFSGNAQRMVATVSGTAQAIHPNTTVVSGKNYSISFKYRSSANMILLPGVTGTYAIVSPNTGSATFYSTTLKPSTTNPLNFFLPSAGDWFEIDEISIREITNPG